MFKLFKLPRWGAVNNLEEQDTFRLILLNGFDILVIFLSFCFGLCGRLSWFNCQLSSAR